MRKLVSALALTTVAFAGSTVYFAHQLSVERARTAASAPRLASADPAPARAAPPAPSPVESSAQPRQDAAVMGGGSAIALPTSEAEIKKMQAEYSRTLLAQFEDPERREEMLAQYKTMMRNTFPHVDQALGLTAEEYARFLELVARQQVDLQLANARCVLEPGCQMKDVLGDGGDRRQGEIDQLLGADRAQKFEAYKNTLGERESVAQLRNRLPDAQRLSDDKAESLVSALAEERELLHREAAQRGDTARGFNIGAGLVFAPSESGTLEERYEAARRSSQRLRDRAAQYLSADQMRAFNELQDEALINLRGLLRRKDVVDE